MTKSNEMTAAMFEEIKEKMASMDEKMDDVSYNLELAKNEIFNSVEKRQSRSINIESVVNYLLKSISGIINASIDNLSDENGKIVSKLDKHIDANIAFINEVKLVLKKRKVYKAKIVVLQILAAASILFNIYLINKNSDLKDSEIQLKYLKITNNINEDVESRLDTIFNISRNEEAIEIIKQSVKSK